MDGTRFDTLARSLTTAGSRRQTLLALAGALGLLSLAPRGDAAAKKKKCPPCKKRKKGKCRGKKPDGTACRGGTCEHGRCLACGAGGTCRVFLSSILYDAALGGLPGADATCQGLATAAGLPGTYKAWLSDSTSAPISRFVPSSGPYRLVNGTMIAANWADLTDGTLLAPITVTETGGGLGTTSITWTHTGPNGSRDGVANEHCANWTTNNVHSPGGVGSADQTTVAWTKIERVPCSNHRHLYCFQQS